MAASSKSEAEHATTLDASIHELESIDEDSHIRAPSASPEENSNRIDYFDFGGQQKPPKRSPTYPFVPPGPSEQLRSLSRISNRYLKSQKRKSVPSTSKRTVYTEPNLPGSNGIRHSSTINTNNSASFEDTAVWDQKAILSLGMYPLRTPSRLRFVWFLPQSVIVSFAYPLL